VLDYAFNAPGDDHRRQGCPSGRGVRERALQDDVGEEVHVRARRALERTDPVDAPRIAFRFAEISSCGASYGFPYPGRLLFPEVVVLDAEHVHRAIAERSHKVPGPFSGRRARRVQSIPPDLYELQVDHSAFMEAVARAAQRDGEAPAFGIIG